MVNNSTAYLSNSGIFSFFKFGDVTLKFRTSSKLKEYKSIENWDNGYLVVMADYDKLGITEEYVDITNVLNELHFNSKQFLEPIKKVEIRYE